MRIPRTFTLPVALVERVNKIPSGERSRFVEQALEAALEIRGGRPASNAPRSSASPRTSDDLPPTPLPKIAARKR